MAFTAYDAAAHAIGRARNLLDASRPSVSDKVTTIVRGDMMRLSIVMAVAALDTYMHRLVVERAYTHRDLPGGLGSLGIPFQHLLAQADASADAARAKPHNSRPRVAVKRQLRDRLLTETFQRYEEVSRALGMAGQSGRWEEIGQQLSPRMDTQLIKRRLNLIVQRRNQIVHEGDYRRLERPRRPTRNTISRT